MKKGSKHSEAARAKIGEANRVRVRSEESKRKTGDTLRGYGRGRSLPEETRAKISEAMRGEKHPNFGKTLSPQAKGKISTQLRVTYACRPKKEPRRKKGLGRKGENNACWRGGRTKDTKGYILVHSPNHPNVAKSGYVYEHRLVMEAQLGRYLEKHEVVHHLNGIKDDNRPENLRLATQNTHHPTALEGYKDGYRRGYQDGVQSRMADVAKNLEELRKGNRLLLWILTQANRDVVQRQE